jgi:hypothetical protein
MSTTDRSDASDRELLEAAAKAGDQRYGGVGCMCVLTGCRAGPGCPLYCSHCKAHIAHVQAASLSGAKT